MEARGGGQSYIDFSTSAIAIADWNDFFSGIQATNGTNGPGWEIPVYSLGTPTRTLQNVVIQQRRATSVSIRSQKLRSEREQ